MKPFSTKCYCGDKYNKKDSMECPCEPVASEPTGSRGAYLDKTRSTHGRNYRLSGVSTESRSRGHRSGGGLGESKCWRVQRPLETTEKGSGQWRSRALPRGCQNNHGKAKGLSSGHSHLSILLGENPLYRALGNHL